MSCGSRPMRARDMAVAIGEIVTEEQFGRLVRRIEVESAERGYANYLRRTWLLGWIGVAFPFVLFVASFALVSAALAFAPLDSRVVCAKVFLLLLVALYLAGRAAAFRWPAPAGVRLEAHAFPDLFALLERLGRAQRCAPPDAVYLDGSFNAAVAPQPPRGFWGFWRKRRIFLTVGLPLMDSLSPEQFVAVLAHEFGHLASSSGATSTQIYAMRLTMEKLAGRSHDQSDLLVRAVGPFYRRFVRYFDAYSCVAARGVEIDADRAAAAQVGNAVFASALVAVNVQDQRIDRDFWEPLAVDVETNPAPPADVYERIAEVAARPLADAAPLLQKALAVVSRSGDTHPSLAERLRALQAPPDDALAPLAAGALRETGSAAGAYLGAGRAQLAADLGARWATDHRPAWMTARREREARLRRLAVLDARASSLSLEESRERVSLAHAVERADVDTLARALLARDPYDAVAHYHIGTVLAERGDPEAFLWLERAAERDADAVVPATECAIELLVKLGRVQEAERLADRAVARLRELDADRARRATCRADERFAPHGLDEASVAGIARILTGYASIEVALLARRTIPSPDPAPAFVLVVERCRRKNEIDDARLCVHLREELAEFGDFFVTAGGGRAAAFRRAVRAVPSATVYVASVLQPG